MKIKNPQLAITEINKNDTTWIDIPSKGETSVTHIVKVHYGGIYDIVIRTSQPGSRPSQSIRASGPAIPPPYDLTFTPSDQSFYWKNPQNMPKELINSK